MAHADGECVGGCASSTRGLVEVAKDNAAARFNTRHGSKASDLLLLATRRSRRSCGTSFLMLQVSEGGKIIAQNEKTRFLSTRNAKLR